MTRKTRRLFATTAAFALGIPLCLTAPSLASAATCADPMTMVFDTTKAGTHETITLSLPYAENITIDWGTNGTAVPAGTGTTPRVRTYGSVGSMEPDLTFKPTARGRYSVRICGTLRNVDGTATHPQGSAPVSSLVEVTSFGTPSAQVLGFGAHAPHLTKVPAALPSNVFSIGHMFLNASSFNQDISGWDTRNVSDMVSTFNGATRFNQPIGRWNTAKVEGMDYMFAGATSFNQDLGKWNVTSLAPHTVWDSFDSKGAEGMFVQSGLSNANYDRLLSGWGQQAVRPGVLLQSWNKYSNAGAAGRASLVKKGWTINDKGVTQTGFHTLVGTPPTANGRIGEATGDSLADVWAMTSTGRLDFFRYANKSVTKLGVRGTELGHISYMGVANDQNGDKRADLFFRDSRDQSLRFAYSKGNGYLSGGRAIGSRWGQMDQIWYAGPMMSGSSTRYVLARNATDGSLWRYAITSRGLGAGVKVGSHWNGMRMMMSPGNMYGDAAWDVVAVHENGNLYGYKVVNGRLVEMGVKGHGWGSIATAFTPGDITGDGRLDMIARTDSGDLYAYGNTPTRWTDIGRIGTGFGGYKVLA